MLDQRLDAAKGLPEEEQLGLLAYLEGTIHRTGTERDHASVHRLAGRRHLTLRYVVRWVMLETREVHRTDLSFDEPVGDPRRPFRVGTHPDGKGLQTTKQQP